MKTTLLLLGLMTATVSFGQDKCIVTVTDNSETHPLQAQFTCKPSTFTFSIFDRWGEEIFRTDDPDFMWDEKNKQGKKVQEGTYVYSLVCTFQGDKKRKVSGQYTVVY